MKTLAISPWVEKCIIAMAVMVAVAARADDVGTYSGKQIRMIIATNSGGAYDLYARTIARHMGQYLPGRPTFIPENMEGAGGRSAANWLYNIAPRDGSVIATISQSAPLDQARQQSGIQFDVARFGWIGNPVIDNLITVAWRDSGLTTIAAVKAKGGMICGGSGASTPGIINPQILNNLLGTRIRIIAGYPGILQVGLAMQQGEVNCMAGNSWSSMRSGMADFLSAHQLNMLVQWGPEKNPAVSAYQGQDVPMIDDFAVNELDRKVLRLINSGVAVGRPLLTPPGLPPPRLAALRSAFDATMNDPSFLADAAAQGLDVSPVPGKDLQQIVTDVAAPDAVTLARAKELLRLNDFTETDQNR
jgi:tripartite-type tricarboxylate transporter receptor subunit TctC